MRAYVLTETDSSDVTWCYNETFFEREKAVARLREMYHEDVVERADLVVDSFINTHGEKANAEMVDGVFLAWNIKETTIQ